MNEVATVGGGAAVVADDAPAASMMNFIASALANPAVNVDKLDALLRMQREVSADQAKSLFSQAFIRLQGRLPRIKKNGVLEYPKDKTNPDGPKRKITNFAKWEDIDAAIRPIYLEEGFALSFDTAPRSGDGGGLVVTAILEHRAGHERRASIQVPLDTSGGKNNLQGYGSTESYGMRYSAKAVLNLIFEGEDDDGARGGMRFITEPQVGELRALLGQAGRQEGPFLDRLFSGLVRSVEEVEAANFVIVKNMLDGIIKQRAAS